MQEKNKCYYDIDDLNNTLYILFEDEDKFYEEKMYWINNGGASVIGETSVLFCCPVGKFHGCTFKGQDMDYENNRFILALKYDNRTLAYVPPEEDENDN